MLCLDCLPHIIWLPLVPEDELGVQLPGGGHDDTTHCPLGLLPIHSLLRGFISRQRRPAICAIGLLIPLDDPPVISGTHQVSLNLLRPMVVIKLSELRNSGIGARSVVGCT